MRKRTRRSDPKTGANSKSKTSALPQRSALFGPPLLLEGEEAAAYDQLHSRICEAVKPVNVIEEMLIDDLISLEWEVLRWRRLKWNLISGFRLKALEEYLGENVVYPAEDFAAVLREILPKDEADAALDLAFKFCADEPDAVRRVNVLLGQIKTDLHQVVRRGRRLKAEILVREYQRGEPDAITQVDELLAEGGESLDRLTAAALGSSHANNKLLDIERIDRLTTIAESRRNGSLREIDRRRAVLGAALRRNVQEIENTEYKLIEATPRGKSAH